MRREARQSLSLSRKKGDEDQIFSEYDLNTNYNEIH